MQIVIDIPEEEYQSILLTGKASFCAVNAIEAGTLLPKGHGKLIDRGALPMVVQSLYDIRLAPTIIEADTESEDKE